VSVNLSTAITFRNKFLFWEAAELKVSVEGGLVNALVSFEVPASGTLMCSHVIPCVMRGTALKNEAADCR
jgi:hypothetical protein